MDDEDWSYIILTCMGEALLRQLSVEESNNDICKLKKHQELGKSPNHTSSIKLSVYMALSRYIETILLAEQGAPCPSGYFQTILNTAQNKAHK